MNKNHEVVDVTFCTIVAPFAKEARIELSKVYFQNSDIIRWNEQLHGYLCHISMFVLYKILSGIAILQHFRCQNIIKPRFMNDNFSSKIAIKLQFCHCESNKKVVFNNDVQKFILIYSLIRTILSNEFTICF